MLISVRRATEMFQFTHGLLPGLCVQPGVSRDESGGVAPFGYSGLFACMQLPLNVSPVSASFLSRQHQGIHLVLVVACSQSLLPASSCEKEGLVILCFGSSATSTQQN